MLPLINMIHSWLTFNVKWSNLQHLQSCFIKFILLSVINFPKGSLKFFVNGSIPVPAMLCLFLWGAV